MRAVSLLLLAALALPSPARADIATGLIGWWPFNGNAQDASGNGNDGTPNGSALLTADRFGTPNSAYHFNGVDSRIDIPSSPSLASPTTALSVAAWIRRDGWGMVGEGYNPILTKSTSTVNAFQYRLITTTAGFNLSLNSWNTHADGSFTFDADRWYHVAAVWDGDTTSFYVDGVLVDQSPLATTIASDARDLSIGSDIPGVLETFYGDIDEVRLYDRALSAADVAELAGHTTSVSPSGIAHGALSLGAAFPNPFARATTIEFTVPAATTASVEVLDLAGRRVRSLMRSRAVSAGAHRVRWDGRDEAGRPVGQGLYFYRVRVQDASRGGRLLRLD